MASGDGAGECLSPSRLVENLPGSARGVLEMKDVILSDSAVADSGGLCSEELERLYFYFEHICSVRRIPVEATPWGRDELMKNLDRLLACVQQAILGRVRTIMSMSDVERSEAQRVFLQRVRGIVPVDEDGKATAVGA
jgi:hypothetical protein